MYEALGAGYGAGSPRRPACRRAIAARSVSAARGQRGRAQHRVQGGRRLSTETSAPIWGYNAELERALVIGPPTADMRRLFDHTVAAQQVAFAAIRPGATCADVDGAVMRYFEENDLLRYRASTRLRDRSPQSRGAVPRRRRPHALEPGMVFTIEPACTTRRSATSAARTVVVTEDGPTSSRTTRATSRVSRFPSDSKAPSGLEPLSSSKRPFAGEGNALR